MRFNLSCVGNRSWRLRAAGAVAAMVVLLLTVGALSLTPASAAEMQTLEIATKTGVHVFSVEVMKTDAERERGLMFRKELPDGRGMLFDFRPDQNVSMWMKNTLIPLDMIFVRGDGHILRIAENTQVQSEKIIPSGGPVRGVIEVIAGTAKKYGIAPGDLVGHPLFGSR